MCEIWSPRAPCTGQHLLVLAWSTNYTRAKSDFYDLVTSQWWCKLMAQWIGLPSATHNQRRPE